MLYRSDVSKDVTGEFLTVEQDVILHCYSDRVRVGVVLIDDGGVVPVHIIDRDIRTRGEGIVDKSLA